MFLLSLKVSSNRMHPGHQLLCIFPLLVVGSLGLRRSLSCGSNWRAVTNTGSCGFDRGALCGWSNERGDGWDWAVKKSVARMEYDILDFGNKAVLTSPALCQPTRSAVCVGLRYKLASPRGRKLYIQRCSSAVCETVWSADEGPTTLWKGANVSFEAQGIFTIRVTGETSSFLSNGDIYIDDLTYTNASCDQTKRTRRNFNVTATTAPKTINVRTPTQSLPVNVTPSVIPGRAQGSSSSEDDVDSTPSSGIVAAGVAIAMVIGAAAVVTRYYVKSGRCRETLLKKKKPSQGQVEKRSPFAASNELYNVSGNNRRGNCRPLEIVLTQQVVTNEPEADVYAEIDYIDAPFPRRSQRSLPHSVNTCAVTVNGDAQNINLLTPATAETRETIYQNVDSGEYSGENSSFLKSSCMTKETLYQDMDSGL